MKVTITKCANTNPKSIEGWYKDRIGEVFEVEWSSDYYHFVSSKKYDGEKKANYINIEDCEINI